MKNICIYLFNGFSDWEISYLTPEINKDERFNLVFFADSKDPIKSMGGLSIQPSHSLSDLDINDIDLLVLPGGTAWESGDNTNIEETVRLAFSKEIPIASICAATIYLGNLGLLDNIKHTSNDLNYLKAVAPNYKGYENYQNQLAVSDENIITASGIAPIEFAKEIFKKIELFPTPQLESWYKLFKHGIWEG